MHSKPKNVHWNSPCIYIHHGLKTLILSVIFKYEYICFQILEHLNSIPLIFAIMYHFKQLPWLYIQRGIFEAWLLITTWNIAAFNSCDYNMLWMLLGTIFEKFTNKVKKRSDVSVSLCKKMWSWSFLECRLSHIHLLIATPGA